MKKYKVLCLTDHSGHSAENSVYALLRGFVNHPFTGEVLVASRGNPENQAFFEDGTSQEIKVKRIKPDFEFEATGTFFSTDTESVTLRNFDIIFMRLPRPVSDNFLSNLKTNNPHCIIINDPEGIIKTSSKAFLLKFPELCPPITLCHSVDEILELASNEPIVLKPLREYGGKGIIKVDGEKVNDGEKNYEAKEFLSQLSETIEQEGMLAMKYLKNVDQGDKRLIVVNGNILAASLRLPAQDSWLCNVAQGGTSVPGTPDEDEIEIVRKIAPELRKEGILIFGADTLVGDDGKRVLSEINTLSIGGFPQSQLQTGRPIIKQTIELIYDYVSKRN